MKVILQNVDYKEKDRVKALGAKWDPYEKYWYVTNQEDLTPFTEWIPEISKFYKDYDSYLKKRPKNQMRKRR